MLLLQRIDKLSGFLSFPSSSSFPAERDLLLQDVLIMVLRSSGGLP